MKATTCRINGGVRGLATAVVFFAAIPLLAQNYEGPLPAPGDTGLDGSHFVENVINLGVDPKHADQMSRGAVVLPHGTGKSVRILVFAKGEKEHEAREAGADILVMARTDARAEHGLEEAIERCRAFVDAGADILFLEAPRDESEMEKLCRALPQLPKMANIVEDGETPALAPERLAEIGYKIAAYPLTLLSVAARAMQDALADLAAGRPVEHRLSFESLQALVGFPEYDAALARYDER